jgi:hypothetical protein
VKSLFLILALFSLINSAFAQNLCDDSCEFTATFPEGGSLEAIDELTLTFGTGGELILGEGGTVNTAIQPSSLDFSSGRTLLLSAGESITFGPGGSLVLGTGGNIDALGYNLITTGDISIGATGGNQVIYINGDLSVSGALSFSSPTLELGSTITAGSQLNLENSTTISGSNSIIVPESTTLTIENVVTEPSSGSLTLSSNSGVIISPVISSTPLPLNFQPLQSLDGFNGFELPTSDGGNCTVASPECISDDGAIYVLTTEGSLVKKEAPSDSSTSGSSGSLDLSLLGFFMILLFSPGIRKKLSSET